MQEIKERGDVLRYIQRQLDDSKSIMPSLPQVLVRVQKAVSDKEMGAKDLANVILDDPNLTASVLRLANSAYYRQSRTKIRTITSAIVLLGFETLRNLTLGLSVYNMLSNLPKVRNYRQVWRHSLCCAVCAKNLAQAMKIAVPEEAFVAGLLHDMGKLILGQFFPEHYSQVLNMVESSDCSFIQAEQQVLKSNHMEAGQAIAKHWNFPDEILKAIGNHELDNCKDGIDPAAPDLVKIIIAANKISHYIYKDNERGQSAVTFPEVEDLCNNGLKIAGQDTDGILAHLKQQVQDIAQILDIVIDDWRYGGDAKAAARDAQEEVSHGGPSSRDKDKLSFLLQCNQKAASCADFTEFLRDTTEDLFQAMDLNYVFLLIHNREYKVLEAKFGYGPDIESIRDRIAIRTDTIDDVAARAFVQRSPVSVNPENMQLFSRVSGANLVSLLGTFNIAAIPIILNDRIVAILVAARSFKSENINAEDIGILSIYGQNLTSVLQRTRARGQTAAIRKGHTSTSIFRRSDQNGGQ